MHTTPARAIGAGAGVSYYVTVPLRRLKTKRRRKNCPSSGSYRNLTLTHMGVNVRNCFTHGGNLLSVFVRNFAAELVLEGHN